MECNGCHIGIKNNSEKVSWEFDSTIMQNMFDILLLPCFVYQHGCLITYENTLLL